jgi:DNA mismatch repair protein MutS
MSVKESGNEVTFLRKLVPGAASTSYGIYCARIAGLPQSIIERSYALLNQPDSAVKKSYAEVQQIKLFDEVVQEKPNETNEVYQEIITALTELDLLSTTPIQAISMIDAWKKKLN